MSGTAQHPVRQLVGRKDGDDGKMPEYSKYEIGSRDHVSRIEGRHASLR